jgi:hypothetical protein
MNENPAGLTLLLKIVHECPPIKIVRDPERAAVWRLVWPVVFPGPLPPRK